MVTASVKTQGRSWKSLLATVVSTRSTSQLPTDCSLLVVRIVLAWIFIYYGGGKLFGWFNGLGIHETSIYFSQSAHLHPGGLFAVLGGVIEFFGAIAVGLGLFSRLAGVALFGDMVMAMITVTWSTGINFAHGASRLPTQPRAGGPGPGRGLSWIGPVQPRRGDRATADDPQQRTCRSQ